jgi:hypothetical protein
MIEPNRNDAEQIGCVMRICSSGQDFRRRSLSAKGGPQPQCEQGLKTLFTQERYQ